MKFRRLAIRGAYLIEPQIHSDHRGFFARTWCRNEFAEEGITRPFDQSSLSRNSARGTLRGLHFQLAPHEEAKLVTCTAGAVWDVIVDLRPGSPTEMKWVAVELSSENHKQLYIPEGCAHGFQTLADDTDVFYQIAGPYHQESAGGIHWQDPDLAIDWPIENPILSERDGLLPFIADIRKYQEAV